MQRKFVNSKPFTTQTTGFGQPLVNQTRFAGHTTQAANHRSTALLPLPEMPPIRNLNFNNRTKKNYNANANTSQNPLFNIPRNKINTQNIDNRVNHKFDLLRKPVQMKRPKMANKSVNEPTISSLPIQQDMPPNMVLSITNYPPSCNEAALIMFFAKIEGFLQLFNHRSKKLISFVIYNSVDQAKEALSAYHGYQMDHEHKLQVNYSNHEMAFCD